MMNKIFVPNEPPQIRNKMLPEVEKILRGMVEDIEIGAEFFDNMKMYVPTDLAEDTWYCTANARIRISRWGIKQVKIVGTESINVSFHLYYKDKYIGDIKTSYVEFRDKERIIIKNLPTILAFINLKICMTCKEHIENCLCEMSNNHEEQMQGEYINIPGLADLGDIGEVEVIEDVTGIFGKEEPEIDFRKHDELVMGISKTYKMGKKETEQLKKNAHIIVQGNPEISEEELFIQLMKNLK